jgi:hypothetical protein
VQVPSRDPSTTPDASRNLALFGATTLVTPRSASFRSIAPIWLRSAVSPPARRHPRASDPGLHGEPRPHPGPFPQGGRESVWSPPPLRGRVRVGGCRRIDKTRTIRTKDWLRSAQRPPPEPPALASLGTSTRLGRSSAPRPRPPDWVRSARFVLEPLEAMSVPSALTSLSRSDPRWVRSAGRRSGPARLPGSLSSIANCQRADPDRGPYIYHRIDAPPRSGIHVLLRSP